MADVDDLRQILIGVLGSPNVYLQPPASLKMLYPCITFSPGAWKTSYAHNKPYILRNVFTVTTIDPDVLSPLPERVAALSTAKFVTRHTTSGLYHVVFELYSL